MFRSPRFVPSFLVITAGVILLALAAGFVAAKERTEGAGKIPRLARPTVDRPSKAFLDLKRRAHRSPTGHLNTALELAPPARAQR